MLGMSCQGKYLYPVFICQLEIPFRIDHHPLTCQEGAVGLLHPFPGQGQHPPLFSQVIESGFSLDICCCCDHRNGSQQSSHLSCQSVAATPVPSYQTHCKMAAFIYHHNTGIIPFALEQGCDQAHHNPHRHNKNKALILIPQRAHL
jgi:hypothetical protein